jgi:hypothetical protein
MEKINSDLLDFPNTFQMDNAYLYMRMRCWQGKIASSTDQIRPCLSPFQFRSILEVMLQTHWKLRSRNKWIVEMLAKFQPRIADFPLEHGFPALPLKWNNFYRFFPFLEFYWDKILLKVLRKMTGRRTPEMPQYFTSARLQLYRENEVNEIMNAEKMRIRDLIDLDSNALSNFIAQSRNTNFAYNLQWRRLLSIEYGLRALKK